MLTVEQHKSLIENVMSWDDLHEDTQKRIVNRKIMEFIKGFSIIEYPSSREDVALFYAARNAMEKAQDNYTPWFFSEFFLEEKIKDGTKTVEAYLRERIVESCKKTIFYSNIKMESI